MQGSTDPGGILQFKAAVGSLSISALSSCSPCINDTGEVEE